MSQFSSNSPLLPQSLLFLWFFFFQLPKDGGNVILCWREIPGLLIIAPADLIGGDILSGVCAWILWITSLESCFPLLWITIGWKATGAAALLIKPATDQGSFGDPCLPIHSTFLIFTFSSFLLLPHGCFTDFQWEKERWGRQISLGLQHNQGFFFITALGGTGRARTLRAKYREGAAAMDVWGLTNPPSLSYVCVAGGQFILEFFPPPFLSSISLHSI